MQYLRYSICMLIGSLASMVHAQEDSLEWYSLESTDTLIEGQKIPITKEYNPVRDPKRLLLNTTMYVGTTIVAFGILWVLPENVSNWDKEEIKEDGFFNKWKENVTEGPLWDKDDWFLNYVTHPYSGAVYYMSARGSGYKPVESFVYSVLMSTFFWEYGVESFAEVPSWQDLIVTPTTGALLGEGFFILKKKIIKHDRKVLKSRVLGETSLFLIDPFNEILDKLGYKSNKAQAFWMPIPDGRTGKNVMGIGLRVSF